MQEMLRKRSYGGVNQTFLVLAGLIDGCTRWVQNAPLRIVHVLYIYVMIGVKKSDTNSG